MNSLDANKKLMDVAESKSRENRVRQRNEDRIREAASEAARKRKELEDWYEQQRLDRVAARLNDLELERKEKEDAEAAAAAEAKRRAAEEARAAGGKKKKKGKKGKKKKK